MCPTTDGLITHDQAVFLALVALSILFILAADIIPIDPPNHRGF
jgi:hypothetical protein